MAKIAVTGVGGGVGQSIIKALQNSKYELVKIDGDRLAAGLYTRGKSYLGTYASQEKEFIDRIIEICKKEQCEVLFPGLDIELPLFAKYKDKIFQEVGTKVVVSSSEVISIADDKFLTSRFLNLNGFAFPQTVVADIANGFNFPGILKPKTGGARSKGCFYVDDREAFVRTAKVNNLDLSNYVLQEYLLGDEYTCGSVTFGENYGVIPIRRILRDGDTYKAFVEDNKEIQSYVAQIAKALGPFGPCNFQFRFRDEEIVVFEINARCSGTTGVRALAGFNEPLVICDYLLEDKISNLVFREISVLRYWQELVVSNDKIRELTQDREANNVDGSL